MHDWFTLDKAENPRWTQKEYSLRLHAVLVRRETTSTSGSPQLWALRTQYIRFFLHRCVFMIYGLKADIFEAQTQQPSSEASTYFGIHYSRVIVSDDNAVRVTVVG